jgi:hypothetical protein
MFTNFAIGRWPHLVPHNFQVFNVSVFFVSLLNKSGLSNFALAQQRRGHDFD